MLGQIIDLSLLLLRLRLTQERPLPEGFLKEPKEGVRPPQVGLDKSARARNRVSCGTSHILTKEKIRGI